MFEEFIDYLRAERRYSEHTVAAYGRDLQRFAEFAVRSAGPDSFDPSLVSAADAREWVVSLAEEGIAPSSINRMCSSVRAYYRWLRMKGIVDSDPMQRISNMKTPSRLPTFVPESKIGHLTSESPAAEEEVGEDYVVCRDRLIVLLFYTTGMRLAELAGMRLADFSDDFRQLRVRGKGGKERVIPVIDYTRLKIKDFISRFKGGEICFAPEKNLFLNSNGRPVSRSTIYNVVRRILGEAGVQGKRSPHVLRHTFATHLLNSGADIRDIQELLGHGSLAATQVYTHNSISRLKEVYSAAHPRGGKKE